MGALQAWMPAVLPAVVAALAALVVGFCNLLLGRWTARLNFDAKMVEIGVSILAADPNKTDVSPARQWAIDLVSDHSGHPFGQEDRERLLHNAIRLSGTINSGSSLVGHVTVTPP